MKKLEVSLPSWDGESVAVFEDELTGANVIIAIHSTRNGKAAGGTRMKAYEELEDAVVDAQRLAAGMTLKWRGAGIPLGGGKAVITMPEDLDVEARRNLLQRYGHVVAELETQFMTGPDLGTASEDMDIIAGSAPGRALGRTRHAGGSGDPAPYTALGVYEAMRVTARRVWGKPELGDRRVVIQGLGNVGSQLVTLLLQAEARVTICDTNPAVEEACEQMGLPVIPPNALFDVPCDIFAPCATGNVLRRRTIRHLQCRAVVGAANNQLGEAEDAERLKRHDILYAPDYIASCGGAIAIVRLEVDGWDEPRVRQAITETIDRNLGRIYDVAAEEDITTEAAARAVLGAA